MKFCRCIFLTERQVKRTMIEEKEKVIMYPNLLAEIARSGDDLTLLAELLNMSPSSVSRRLNGSIEWSKSEIDTLCDHYKKSYDYLFGKKC